jgi:hypothetical protein
MRSIALVSFSSGLLVLRSTRSSLLHAQDPFGGGDNAEQNGGLFAGKPGLDDEAAELDFMPGIVIPTQSQPPPETRFSEIRLCFFTIIRYDLRARPGVLR